MRDRSHKVVAGVTGGIARKLRMNVKPVRIFLRLMMILPPFFGFWFLVYMVIWLATPIDPKLKRSNKRDDQLPAEAPAGDPAVDMLEQVAGKVRLKFLLRQVSKPVHDKVLHVYTLLKETVPQTGQTRAGLDYDIYTLRQTALEYFPETVETYLNLPARYAREHRLSDGKTAEENLLEQLILIEQSVEEVATDIYENDAKRVQIQGRFLADRLEREKILR
jgi:phage shock protein PspC (stress-responsive transcriptional regulator)